MAAAAKDGQTAPGQPSPAAAHGDTLEKLTGPWAWGPRRSPRSLSSCLCWPLWTETGNSEG